MDEGETPLQAAERETREEAGLDKNDLEHLKKFEEKITYNVNGKPKDVFYYLARIRNDQKNIEEPNCHSRSYRCIDRTSNDSQNRNAVNQ